MPTMNRAYSPGSFFHLMARGIDGHNLFNDDEDHYEFLRRLRKSLISSDFRCISWNLMDNHYHLFVQSSEKPLCSLMRPLNSGYARWYNRKNKRKGHLFQDRFKSLLCEDSHHVSQLIRYIHLNPIRANMISSYEKLDAWRWSSHNLLLGNPFAIGADFVDRTTVLNRFSQNENDALRMYNLYMQDGIDVSNLMRSGWLPKTEQAELNGAAKGWLAVAGSVEYVRNAMSNHPVGLHRLHRKDDYKDVLNSIASQACKGFNLTLNELKRRGRNNARSQARAFFCFKANKEEKLPLTVIANYLLICISPTAELVRKGEIANGKITASEVQKIPLPV